MAAEVAPAQMDDDVVAPPEAQEAPAQLTEVDRMKKLIIRLGFSKEATKYLVEKQDLKTLEALSTLSDDDVSKVCKICRKPGGSIQRNRTTIPHPGHHVAMTHEMNLGLAAFYLKHMKMTSRSVDVDDVTIANIKEIKDFKTEIEKREDPLPETAPKLTKKNKFEWFELFKDYLNEYTGSVSKRPLGYVVRSSFEVKPEATDLSYGHDDSEYTDFYDEIQHRAPIKHAIIRNDNASFKQDPHFRLDNNRVWTLLSKTLEGTSDATYIEKHKSKKDGREAFLHLHQQLLGSEAISNEASAAENALADSTLRENVRAFQLEDFIKKHIRQHTILHKLKKFGHSGIDENSKIRHFIKGIQDAKYAPVKASLAVKCPTTFDDVVTAFRTFEQNQKLTAPRSNRGRKLNVSSTTTGNRKAGSPGPTQESDGFDENETYEEHKINPNVYYKGNHWNQLTKGQRNYLRKQRLLQRNKRKRTKGNNSESAKLKRRIEKKDAKIAALTRQISSVEVSSSSNESDDSSLDERPSKRMKEPTKIPRKKVRISKKN